MATATSHKLNDELFHKNMNILDGVSNTYLIEKQYAAKTLKDFSVMLCGPPRVGKSELINALCGRKVAATSESLDSCTKGVQCYTIQTHHKSDDETIDVNNAIHFWDTPGIESWNERDVQIYVDSITKKALPICMLFCASPGSFANLNHLQWLVERCVRENIFCALICTNMYSSNQRAAVMQDFKKVLQTFGQEKYDANTKITYFGQAALSTMVNSVHYTDSTLNISKEPFGVDELIYAILTSLTDEKVEGWINAILENRSFWTKMSHRTLGYLNETPSGQCIKKILKSLCFGVLQAAATGTFI